MYIHYEGDSLLRGAKDFENPINAAFQEIEKSGGEIIKTQYFASSHGFVEEVVIEYEVGESSEGII